MTDTGRCDAHRRQERRQHDERRGSSSVRGYGSQWQRAREQFLAEHPLCVVCRAPATVVDHIKPHKGDIAMFWDSDNWQQLCKKHHDIKTAKQDGRWG